MDITLAVQKEPGSKRALRNLFGLLPIEMRITGRRRDLAMYLMDLLYAPPAAGSRLEHITTPDGRHFRVDPGQFNQRLLSCYYSNLLRHYRTSPLNRLLTDLGGRQTPPGTFLDVGANLGFYSLLARDAGFDTVVIEAEPTHAEFLQRHPDLFPKVHPVAVGDAEGLAEFFVSQQTNPGGSSMVAGESSPADRQVSPALVYDGSVSVRVRRLDTLLGELPDEGASVRVIKIDVEGYEAAVVRGMAGFLDRGHRPVIWCEVRGPDSDRAPDSYRAVCEALQPFGYRSYWGEKPGMPAFSDCGGPLPQVFDLLFTTGAEQR